VFLLEAKPEKKIKGGPRQRKCIDSTFKNSFSSKYTYYYYGVHKEFLDQGVVWGAPCPC
jgi:hypothetical protein